MEKKTVADISDNLSCEPIKVCSSAFVPMVRKRNYWGNIPRMEDICTNKEQATSLKLQQFLRPNRTANCTAAKTITSNKTNQISGHKWPVIMDGTEVNLNVNDIESLMGFPIHFTDGCDLSNKQRLQLLSKSWCDPVIIKILEPLQEIFLQK